jgi:hypothetical protein
LRGVFDVMMIMVKNIATILLQHTTEIKISNKGRERCKNIGD